MTTAITIAERPKGPCPDLALLETAPLAASVAAHVEGCPGCALVVDVYAERNAAIGDCSRFEALLSARLDGTLNAAGKNLLDRHLAGCADCREAAETLSPTDEGDAVHTSLPEVDPASYKIGKAIAQGGMGRILSAQDLRVGRPVAIKELLGDSPRLASRFEREARLTARLQHPNIIPIYEIGRWPADGPRPGKPFYSMRIVEGRQLRVAIERAATLPERLALVPSLIAACEAVAFAHSQRVIHRDLTPSNILVGDYGETVVIDWGLAKNLGEELRSPLDEMDPGASDRLTNVGTVMGTAAYMPPEQAHAQPADERSDVYALGAILYHLLAGVPPFRGGTREELLRAVRSGTLRAVELEEPGSPRDLVTIVKRAMEFLPANRYQSARELAEELERFQTGRLVEAHHYSRGELIKRFLVRNRAAVTVTVLATIMLSVLGVISVRRIIASSAEAREQATEAKQTARALLFEKGRVELLDGEPLRALAYLHEVARQGEVGPEIDLLLGRTLVDLGSAEHTLECGSDDRHVDVSPDGTLLVAACHDRAKVWRIRDAKGNAVGPTEIATLGSTNGFDNLRFSNAGTVLATWGDDGVVRLWRLGRISNGAPKSIDLVHGTSTITMASFSRDDRIVSTTGVDGFARIWDAETGAQRFEISPTTPIPKLGAVFGRLAERGRTELLVLAPLLGVGRRYDVDTTAELASFELGGPVLNGELSADGTLAVACGLGNAVKVIDVVTDKLRFDLVGHTDVVWKCVFSADGTRVLTSSHDRTAKVWDITSTSARLVTTANHGDLVWLSRFSPDGRRFFTVSPGKSIKVWDTSSGGLLASYDSRGKDGRFLPDGRFAALRGDGRIQLWGRTSVRLAAFDPPTGASIVAATPDGDFATDGPAGVAVWDRSGRRLAETLSLLAPVAASRRQIASMYATTTDAETAWGIAVIDPLRGSVAKIAIETAATPVFPLAIQPAGTRVAVSWSTRDAEIWDVATGARVLAIPDANRVILDDDGKHAVAWRERDGVVASLPVVWDVERRARQTEINAIDARPIGFALGGTRLLVTELVRAPSQVVSVFGVADGTRVVTQPNVDIAPTLDPTGRWMTTIDKDRIVTVWSVADGAKRSRFSGLPLQLAQSNGDGTLLVAIAEYGRAVLVVSPADGRILVRHALDHDRAIVTLDSFRAPPASAWWTSDSTAFASTAKGLSLWRAKNAFSASAIAEVVRKRVPWRIDNGTLELIRDGRITGRVTRDGVPAGGVAIECLVRRPADLSDKPASWESMKARLVRRTTTTDSDGRFVIDLLELGELEYRVSASDGTLRVDVQTTASVEGEPIELRLR